MKQLLLIIFALVLISGISKAQTIPNGDFETWNTTAYNEPDSPWVTSNFACIAATGHPNVTKVAGFSGQGIHLQTYIDNKHDTLVGEVSNFGGFNLGVPYTQKPTAIKGYFRCSMTGHDTAYLAIGFIQGGYPYYIKYIPFYGNVSSFTLFTDTMNLPFTPDSLIIAAVSSNLMNNVGVNAGSWLELDELTFTGTGITQQIADGNFEGWMSHSIDFPAGWQVSTVNVQPGPGSNGNGVSRSNDHYSGNYSIELASIPYLFGPQITTGHFDQTGSTLGGLPYSKLNDTLTGYYKYTTSGADSGIIVVSLQKNGMPVDSGGAGFFFTPTSSWKYFEVLTHANATPDTMRIDISSTSDFSGMTMSSLYLDHLQLKSQPFKAHNSGIDFNTNPSFGITAFPDPAQNQLNISLGNNIPSEFGLKIYNIEGRLMIEKEFNSGSSTVNIPIDQLSAGLYFYEVTANSFTVRSKFVKGK